MALLDISYVHTLTLVLVTIGLATSFHLLPLLGKSLSRRTSTASPPLPPLPASDEIVALRVYPVKSCRGFEVKSTQLLRTGLDLDRSWMFIAAETREFITIRTNSNLTLIRTSYDPDTDQLIIGLRDYKFDIPAHPTNDWLSKNAKLAKAGIWGEQTDGWEYPASLTQPISDFLNIDIRLMFKGPTPRVLRGCGAPKLLGRSEAVKFADMMPVLVGSMASIGELNGRLVQAGENEIEIERFRPNIIIRGNEPWIEDGWKALRINDGGVPLDLDVVCRCLRCQVPNVHPETADKHPRQPWDQLMKYRRIDPGLKFKPSFGMLCVPRTEGLISVGMKFDVTAMTNDHFFINPMK
ncbi:mitochondrial amidoxime-reducing component 1 [Colletotrichum spaethianum]|uniref:Mitochondrial amidoxime-reducing component 1 n=1 Tax=Colletotrichum spaethianum TaxID=700344 RepID=A0AA37PAN3_9PEZI|nr:mitochondrial amidoxime-reducing component 1 [Colletotrichum spaethianum]GKT48732.1 mitochondrial amidoxime-reducing component 1 [Colletotrichum spaethianum]